MCADERRGVEDKDEVRLTVICTMALGLMHVREYSRVTETSTPGSKRLKW
jgi:hypothetical protein